MVSMLAFFHEEEQALKDKRLGERCYIYLLKRGKLRTKHIDQFNLSDAPYLVSELEANQAMSAEHLAADGEETVTELPGGAAFTPSHYEDATKHLRAR
jgi:hypothetical protein